MKNDDFHENDVHAERDTEDSVLAQQTADAIATILNDTGLAAEFQETKSIAEEMIEKLTSPLMIQRAAGATSQVSIVAAPSGGVESARSTKVSNVLINLKTTAFALPGTLPTLLAVYERNGTPDHVRLAMAAVIALYGWLTVLSKAFRVSLTKRTAGVLRVMWVSSQSTDDIVSYEGLLEEVNARFKEYKWEQIDNEQLLTDLGTLEKIGCIERDSPFGSIRTERIHWRLKESVKVTC